MGILGLLRESDPMERLRVFGAALFFFGTIPIHIPALFGRVPSKTGTTVVLLCSAIPVMAGLVLFLPLRCLVWVRERGSVG
jgi:peptidoglycan biosynthesis protein MviN/MurJ (putative lipid II flippase)